MQGLAVLIFVGWLVSTPWAMVLVSGVIVAAFATFAWVWTRQVLEFEPAEATWRRVEPRFESPQYWSHHRATDDHQDAWTGHGDANQEPFSSPEDENPFENRDEEALPRLMANLAQKNAALEEQVIALQEHIAALESEAADVPTRLREAVISGREQALHAFGHKREEFEAMLREFMRKEQAHAQQDRQRQDEPQRQQKQKQEEAARKRQEQSRRRSRSSRSWWEVLGVTPDASDEEVHRAYRTLARHYHPDRRGTGDTAWMAEINAARDEAMGRFRRAA